MAFELDLNAHFKYAVSTFDLKFGKFSCSLNCFLCKGYCARWLIPVLCCFPFTKELSVWSDTNLSPVLPFPSQSLIGLSVLRLTIVCVCVCFSVFPCRLRAAVSAGSCAALPISADREPELQHPGGRRRRPAEPQRWTVDRESRAGRILFDPFKP